MTTQENVFRVDKFVVPEGARSEFLQRVKSTHQLLRAQPGFIRDAVLEQTSGPGKFNYVTVAEWKSQAAIEAARSVVMANHAQTGFDASEMITRLGIEADIANYKPIDAQPFP